MANKVANTAMTGLKPESYLQSLQTQSLQQSMNLPSGTHAYSATKKPAIGVGGGSAYT